MITRLFLLSTSIVFALGCQPSTPALVSRARGANIAQADGNGIYRQGGQQQSSGQQSSAQQSDSQFGQFARQNAGQQYYDKHYGYQKEIRQAPQRASGLSSRCPSPVLIPYTAIELRSTATLHDYPSQAALSVEEGGRLTCSFDHEREYCSWYNVPNGGGTKFWRARYETLFDLERFDCTSERSFPFEDYFLLAGGEMTVVPQTVAIETVIPCQYGNATLTFDFWVNSEAPTLRLCAVSMDNYFNCEEMVEWSVDGPIATSIPESPDPFKLRIEMSGITHDTIALIDNIRYEGQICELVPDPDSPSPTSPSVPVAPPPPLPSSSPSFPTLSSSSPTIPFTRIPLNIKQRSAKTTFEKIDKNTFNNIEDGLLDGDTRDEDDGNKYVRAKEPETLQTSVPTKVEGTEEVGVCEALTCSFNEEHTCMYSLGGIGSTMPWEHSRVHIGNRLTGIHTNSPGDYKKTGFVYVGKNHKDLSDEVFVMESAKFTLRKSVKMSFDLFLRSFGPQLRVCIDSFDYCPYSSPTIDKKSFWRRSQHIYIPPGVRKIYFIAGQVKQNLFVAIDNIRLKTEDGQDYCDTNNKEKT